VTIKSIGDSYHQGDLFIKSTSSTEDLMNFFINNNIYEISYQGQDYDNSYWSPENVCIENGTKDAILQTTGAAIGHIKLITDLGPVNTLGALAIWSATGSTWLCFLPACNLVAL
jgi:hypothetical protein